MGKKLILKQAAGVKILSLFFDKNLRRLHRENAEGIKHLISIIR